MLRFIFLFFLIFSFAKSSGNECGIEVRILDSLVNATPGQVTAVKVEIINRGCQQRILVGHLELPPHWEAVPANDMLMHVEMGQSAIQTLLIRIPKTAIPGEYPIAYEVWVRDNRNILDRDTTTAIVAQAVQHITPVSIEMTSPKVFEINAGEVVYVCSLIKNDLKKSFEGLIELDIPSLWSCTPAAQTNISLEPEESRLLIYAVKSPTSALAGEHLISINVKDYCSCHQIARAIIKPKIDVCGIVNGLCDSFSVNQIVQLSVCYTNKGNTPLKVVAEVKTEPSCAFDHISAPFEIPPYETCDIPLSINPAWSTNEHMQFVLVRLLDYETGEQLYQNPMTLKFVEPSRSPQDPYVYIPTTTKFMTLGDRYKKVLAVEYAGDGLLDPEEERYLDFVFRIPSEIHHVIYNIDERLYIGMHDKKWDIRLGDTVYELSPLTQRYRYGRGANLQHKGENWEAGVHYTQNTLKSECDPHELCAYLEYNPNDSINLSTNYLHKTEQGIKTSNISTIQAEIDLSPQTHVEFEFGKNFISTEDQKKTWAYRFETNGRFCRDAWFSFEKVYAGADFYGYYNHLHLLSSSLDIPLCHALRLNLNVNHLKQNFDTCLEENPDTIIPRQHQYTANLTYSISPCITFSLNGMLLRGQDMGLASQYNFYQKWTGCSFFFSKMGWSLNTMISVGQQKDYLTHKTTHKLQRYYMFLSKDLSEKLSGSLFYEGGNINYYDARPWRSSYGGRLSYRYAATGSLDLFVQQVKHSTDMLDLSQASFNANYTFRNGHRIDATAQYFYYRSHYPNDTMFLVSYTIPSSLPICRRKDVGELSGTVYDSYTNERICGALVSCGSEKTTTGTDGCFSFRCSPKGEQCPKIEKLPDDLIALNINEMLVDVKGGKETIVVIPVTNSCSIEGDLTLYGYTDLFTALVDPSTAELAPQGGVDGIRVAIAKEDESEVYFSTTNPLGHFCFPKLRPGIWHIKIFKDGLPTLTELDLNDLVIDVLPGEKRHIDFKISPKALIFYKLA